MKWIKASERMPEQGKEVFVKWHDIKYIASFCPTHLIIEDGSRIGLKDIIELYWLDEGEQSENDEDYPSCESCGKGDDIEVMSSDGENWFCPSCWNGLEPVLKAEYEELKAKGELSDEIE